MTPHEEATAIFREVLAELTAGTPELKNIMRKCQHACALMQWQQSKTWFQQELNGYPSETEVPLYRKIHGKLIWRPKGSPYDIMRWAVERGVYGSQSHEEQSEDTLNVWAGIEWLKSTAESGYSEVTGETKEASAPDQMTTITWERARVFQAPYFKSALSAIEKLVFDFVSKSYVELQYGNTISDIWMGYRTKVDTALERLGFSDHLIAIQKGLQSDKPEEWRLSAFGCRNLLHDLAEFLWKDPRSTYDHLPGKGTGNRLDVTQGNFSNRLAAYLHQHSVTGTRGRFYRDELERLSVSIRSLVSVQSEAHEEVNLEDVRSVALATYFIIGELAAKTDMQPIEKYSDISGGDGRQVTG